ncbi:MAG: hypothetical protein ABJA98_06615 [Acidobacteriota bacterium]
MARTTNREPAAEPTAAPLPGHQIAVTNLYRNQPILFHFMGGSVRLGPLETQEIDRGCLASPELAHLVSTGAVKVSELAASESAPGRKAEEV